MLEQCFHPLTAGWFRERFGEPTEPQSRGWPEIVAGRSTLIAAPTGSGKTLSAFLTAIDRLVRRAVEGSLDDALRVLYISPLKALSNDIHRNLSVPLAEIRERAAATGWTLPEIRAAIRTGDTTSSARQAIVRRPPHILVTTPESLYLLLTSAKSRAILQDVETVIVDEIHALVRDKRGSHLALSLARLDALCQRPPQRIGLSATQRPLEEVARFLVGAAPLDDPPPNDPPPDDRQLALPCSMIDVGHLRDLDVGVEVPTSELSAVCSHEIWGEVYLRLTDLIQSHRSTLVFVNTRRLAERVTRALEELLGEGAVTSHHGSLSKELRLQAEERLKRGELRALVATASLELGIDVGYVDLVCQIDSPRSIATFLQRVGRAGHSLGAVPKGRLLPLTRDGLVECLALLRSVRTGELDRLRMPHAPLDILAQQMVAEVASRDVSVDALFSLVRQAWPYRQLVRKDFDELIELLSEGWIRGRRQTAYLHHDGVHGRLRARRHARLTAITCGGAIPELADYRVETEEGTFVGTVNEDFAIESMAGDVFLLGNTSWRVRYVRGQVVTVVDAQGAPATLPFWLGEAPGRTAELSSAVSQLRQDLQQQLTGESLMHSTCPVAGNGETKAEATDLEPSVARAIDWLLAECPGVNRWAAEQVARYVAAERAALGLVPTERRIVFERFFDESGGMQLVIHAPLGAEVNRAWGLALRKRFCRSFDFELQASADDNGVVLSLGPQHSFPIEQLFGMLHPQNAEHLLKQALLAAPMFNVRWRWNATRSLAVLRQQSGKKVPPFLQRFRADDLLTGVFPKQTGCLENHSGDVEIPTHPLVRQTVHDCLHEVMDLPRWMSLLTKVRAGDVELIARDTREPSPFCESILNANPYAFLDPAPLEERRARAVATRRTLSPVDAANLAWLDPAAIEQVRSEAWPAPRDADELHDTLLGMTALVADEGEAWQVWFDELRHTGRATLLETPTGAQLWVAAERLPLVRLAHPEAHCTPPVSIATAAGDAEPSAADAYVAMVRGWIEVAGPTTASFLAQRLDMRQSAVEAALEALEGEGVVLRGQFESAPPGENLASEATVSTDAQISTNGHVPPATQARPLGETQWCERRLLARIHRLTLADARRRIRPVTPAEFWRFLCTWHRVEPVPGESGRDGVRRVIEQLEGLDLPAGAWEQDVLPARIAEYDPDWLDELSRSGELAWGRLSPPLRKGDEPRGQRTLTRAVPLALVLRSDLPWLLPRERTVSVAAEGSPTAIVEELLSHHGALFLSDLLSASGLLPSQLEAALAELAARGRVTADGFAPIRALIDPLLRRRRDAARRRARANGHSTTRRSNATPGRWSLFPPPVLPGATQQREERWARLLLRRWGIVARDLLAREPAAPSWYALVSVFRRLEARGDILGGRFVTGLSGEQYATQEAVESLRRVRDLPMSSQWIAISAADPLNLSGILSADPRVPAVRTGALAICNGQVVAVREAGTVRWLQSCDPARKEELLRDLRQHTIARQRHQMAQSH